MAQEHDSSDVSFNFSFLKKANWTIVLIVAFILLGIYLRSYHLDFPAIGYHNMKENEYLDQAVFFEEKGDFLHKQAFAFYGFDETTGYHEEYGQMPLVPYMILVLWKIFGESLWIARVLMIAFFMAAVLMTYYLVKRVSNNEFISLVSTGLMAVMPLGIFFGRNIQPEPPALFFSLLSLYFYFRWIDDKNNKDIFYATLFLGIAGLFKYTFMIFAVPILFVFPYAEFYALFKKEKKKALDAIKQGVFGFIPFALGVLVYEFLTIVDPSKKSYDVEPFRVFTGAYWDARMPIIVSFIRDNYTLWFFFIAVIGIIFASMKFKSRFGKFMIGYTVAIVPYLLMISSKFAGHSYYQMPFLPLICIASAYAFYVVGSVLKSSLKNPYALFIPLLLIIFIVPDMQAANDRVFGTVFYGQDFLGEYLKTRLQPEERFSAFTSSQDLATCSYSRHRCGFVSSLEEFKHKEDVFDLRYVYVGVTDLNNLVNSQDELWKYIRANYGIDLVGLLPAGGQLAPTHIILKRGYPFDFTEIQGKQPQLAKTYDMKQGPVQYYYIQNIRLQ